MIVSAAAGAYVLLGCGDDDSTPTRSAGDSTATNSTPSAADCILAPEQTEGPYYVDNDLIRRDITEDREGVGLDLRLTVQDAQSCEAIENATVEVWHCDALGEYSGVNGSAGNFLRGGQRTDARGLARFRTIYPGWYQGRTTHIHVKVHVGGSEVHTGQLYFEDSVTARVNRASSPYNSRGAPDTTNAADSIFAQGGDESTVALQKRGSGYVGRLSLGVRS
jgi:protocatechuate 3,4-dioxygenase beta subunit